MIRDVWKPESQFEIGFRKTEPNQKVKTESQFSKAFFKTKEIFFCLNVVCLLTKVLYNCDFQLSSNTNYRCSFAFGKLLTAAQNQQDLIGSAVKSAQ